MQSPQAVRAGFTALEMMIVVAVLVPVLGVLLSGMGSVASTSGRATSQVDAQQHVISTARKVEDQLRTANVTAVAPDGLSITYQHPVDLDGLGPVDAMGGISWGAMEAGGPVAGNSYTLSFVQDDMLQEPLLGVDVNGDGDTVDSYLVGHLRRTSSGGDVRDITGSVFLLNAFDPAGDLNGDGLGDPLFAWTAGQPVTVSLLARIRDTAEATRQSHFTQRRIFLPNME